MTNQEPPTPGDRHERVDRPDAGDQPHNQPTKIDDPESAGTPIGVVGDLEEMAEETGATTDPAASEAGREQLEARPDDR